VALALALLLPPPDLLPPQPLSPATTMAVPPTAITNPRFTTVLLLFGVTRQDQRTIVKQYGVSTFAGQAFAGKS
jgi:hypothetical protein